MYKTRITTGRSIAIRMIAACLISAAMLITLPIHTFAISDGDTVRYTSNESSNVPSFQIVGDNTFEGMCCEKGRPAASSGTAVVTKAGPEKPLAKMAYNVDIRLGWYKSWERNPDITQWGINETYYQTAWDLMQCAAQGTERWSELALSQSYPRGYVNYIVSMHDWTVANITPPANFEVYWADAGSSQNFALWRFAQTGDLTIKKTVQGSSGQTFTFTVKVSGADGTYSGVPFNNGTATVTIRGGESKKIEGLPADASYTVTETNIPSGWSLISKTGDSGTIVSGENQTATFTNKQYGKLNLRKGSSNISITG